MPQPSFFTASLLVASGGGIGAWLRYLVGLGWTALLGPVRADAFPWATLTVNVLGSLAMGLVIGWLARFGAHGESTRLFLAVGLLGGFTTFSSFSMDIVFLAQRGQPTLGMWYAAISVFAGMIGLIAGLSILKAVP
jgi:fluoride exporter